MGTVSEKRCFWWPAFALIVCLNFVGPLQGHQDPSHSVDGLSKALEESPHSINLLLKRAQKQMARGHWAEASADLSHALEHSVDAGTKAEVYFLRSRLQEMSVGAEPALADAKKAFALEGTCERRLHLASLYFELGEKESAAALVPPSRIFDFDEAVLLQARLIQSFPQRTAFLKKAHERIGSINLFEAWLDAAVETDPVEPLRTTISEKITQQRFKAPCLIRLGRLAKRNGEEKQAQVYFSQALEEIEPRLRSTNPDLLLLTDRALARVGLEQLALAREDLGIIQSSGLPRIVYDHLAELVTRLEMLKKSGNKETP